MKKVFPDREIVDFPKDHPIFSCFYKIDGYPQMAGLGSFIAGRSWEKGGFVAHLRTIFDDNQRPMLYHELEHGHGRWLGMVECRGLSRLPEIHVDGVPDGHQRVVYALTH